MLTQLAVRSRSMMTIFEKLVIKLVTVSKILIHNIILHPIAGVIWATGYPELASKVHDLVLPPE